MSADAGSSGDTEMSANEPVSTDEGMSTATDAASLAPLRAFAAALASGDADAAAACFADDATYEEPPRFSFTGQAAIAGFFRDFAARHRDVSFEIVRALPSADGALLAAEWRFAHTRTCDSARAAYAGMCFVTLIGGRITSWRGYSASLG